MSIVTSTRFAQVFVCFFASVLVFQAPTNAQNGVGSVCNALSVQQHRSFPINSTDVDFVKTGDVNNDGIPDVVINLLNRSAVSLQIGDGEGGLEDVVEIPVGGNPSDIELVDVNRDGELDILALLEFSDAIAFLTGDGNGNFTIQKQIAVNFRPKLFEVGNFDNDPYLDIAITYFNTFETYNSGRNLDFLLINSGNFERDSQILRSGDFNGDGITDIAGRFFDGSMFSSVAYTGLSDGSFSEIFRQSDIRAEGIAIGDVNSDQQEDLLIMENLGGKDDRLKTYLGNGDGTFQSFIANETSLFPIGIQLFEMTGDTNIDVLAVDGTVFESSRVQSSRFKVNPNQIPFSVI